MTKSNFKTLFMTSFQNCYFGYTLVL